MRGFRVEGALAEERGGPLVALLLEPLGAHGPEEAMSGQGDMCSARRCRRAALRPQAARYADATLYSTASSRRTGLRPAILAAGGRSRDGRRSRGRQAGLSCRARHAQHAAAGRVALLIGRRHGQSVNVAGAVALFTSCMTSRRKARVKRER